MADDTTKPNAQPVAEPASLAELVHDVLHVAKMQLAAFRFELHRWERELVLPIAALAASVVVALSCLPVLMLSAAYGLARTGAVPMPLSLLIVACGSAAISVVCGLAAWRRIRASRPPFAPFRRELIRSFYTVRALLQEHRRLRRPELRSTRRSLEEG
jgi:protein-S-isoprenylcysteine O-methyltransferase Ste14